MSFENNARLDYEVAKFCNDTFQRYCGMSDRERVVFYYDAVNAVNALGSKTTSESSKLKAVVSDIHRAIATRASKQFLSRE